MSGGSEFLTSFTSRRMQQLVCSLTSLDSRKRLYAATASSMRKRRCTRCLDSVAVARNVLQKHRLDTIWEVLYAKNGPIYVRSHLTRTDTKGTR